MSKFQTKADKAFEEQLATLLAPTNAWIGMGGIAEELMYEDASIHYHLWNEVFEGEALRELFSRYGSYLELIGEDKPVGEPRSFEFIPTKRGGDRKQSIDELVAEANQRITELGDNLVEAFHENNNKKEEA